MRATPRTITLALAVILISPPALAQDTSDSLLRDLLSEVRALRLTLQKSSLLGLRGNLLVERIRTAQARLSTTQRDIDGVRSQLGTLEQEKARIASIRDSLADRAREAYDPGEVKSLEAETSQYESAITMLERRSDGLRLREAELLARLDEDRARVDGLESQFDGLLREIESALEATTTEP